MRNIIITILLALICVGLYAEEQVVPKFALLSPVASNLDLRVSAEMQRLYVTAEFSVIPVLLRKANYYSFFLSKEARIEQVLVNDKPQKPLITSLLVPEHFDPVMPLPELLGDSTAVNCFSYDLDSYKTGEEAIRFKFRYWLPLPQWKTAAGGASYLDLPADSYWFPRNIEAESRAQIRMVSNTLYGLDLVSDAQVSEVDGIRTSTGSLLDAPANPFILKIIRMLN